MKKHKMLPGHQLAVQIMLNMSPQTYWEQYLSETAPLWLGKFYEWKDEKKVEHGEWEPTENLEDQEYVEKYPRLKFTKARRHFAEI